MRFFALTGFLADAVSKLSKSHFFLSRAFWRLMDILGQHGRERSLKGQRARIPGLSKKPCQEVWKIFFCC
jgi:hypothetical protein